MDIRSMVIVLLWNTRRRLVGKEVAASCVAVQDTGLEIAQTQANVVWMSDREDASGRCDSLCIESKVAPPSRN